MMRTITHIYMSLSQALRKFLKVNLKNQIQMTLRSLSSTHKDLRPLDPYLQVRMTTRKRKKKPSDLAPESPKTCA